MSIEFKGVDFSTSISYVGMYSDGTPMVKTDQFEEIVEKADTIIVRASSLAEFVHAMFLYDALLSKSCNDMRLVLPYIPGARQDRVNVAGDVLFTMRSVARMLNDYMFSDIVVADPHSPVAENLITAIKVYPLERIYDRLWKGYGGVIAPDKGAKARAMIAQNVIGGELRYGSKTRDVSTGKITGFDVEDLTPGKHYLVVDDICDGGGTFIGLGEKIREQGCYADLFVTHGIFSKGTKDLKDYYKNIYTTDSRDVHERNDVMMINIVEDMVAYARP